MYFNYYYYSYYHFHVFCFYVNNSTWRSRRLCKRKMMKPNFFDTAQNNLIVKRLKICYRLTFRYVFNGLSAFNESQMATFHELLLSIARTEKSALRCPPYGASCQNGHSASSFCFVQAAGALNFFIRLLGFCWTAVCVALWFEWLYHEFFFNFT